MMVRMANLHLMLSCEVFWFNHPDWKLPWYRKWLRKLGGAQPTAPDQ